MTWGEGPQFENVRNWMCEGCGKKLTSSAKDAYSEGWDVPPYFTGYVKCEDCPITQTAWWIMLQSSKETSNDSR